MEIEKFNEAIVANADQIAAIRAMAVAVHDGVNQKYDDVHPYWLHLDMVADVVRRYGADVCAQASDVAPLFFGAYFHDSIEDARLTYNNVLARARSFFDEDKALMAAEIAYALTNEKGRTRAERANDRYYAGIRITPYAPMVKLADRMANFSYSLRGGDDANDAMRQVYIAEMPHFLEAIKADASDPRLALPKQLVEDIRRLAD